MMCFNRRPIRHVVLAAALALVAASLSAIGTAKADDLVLRCVKNDSNPVFGDIDFTYWIDVSNSRLLAGHREGLFEGTAIINATTIRLNFGSQYNPVNVIIDRTSGSGRYMIDGDVGNIVCSRSSAPRPATKF